MSTGLQWHPDSVAWKEKVRFFWVLYPKSSLFCMCTLSGSIDCPDSHPFACGIGTKCTNSPYKPRDSVDPDCDGGVTDLYRDTAGLTNSSFRLNEGIRVASQIWNCTWLQCICTTYTVGGQPTSEENNLLFRPKYCWSPFTAPAARMRACPATGSLTRSARAALRTAPPRAPSPAMAEQSALR